MIGMNQFLTDIPFSPFKLSFKKGGGGTKPTATNYSPGFAV